MSYTPPQLTPDGLILPTYEERLDSLLESYRSIFGQDAALDASSPDYQLLSLFAKSQDDLGNLILSVFDSRNPQYAAGAALDLLLPLHGLTRLPGETDAAARTRFSLSTASASSATLEAMEDAVNAVTGVRASRIYVNESDTTDERGIPSHSVCAVVEGGNVDDLAQAIYNHKSPGIGTHGTLSGTAHDSRGNPVTIQMNRPANRFMTVQITLKKLADMDPAATADRVKQAIYDYAQTQSVGEDFLVSALYGVTYSAEVCPTPTYAVTNLIVIAGGTQYTGVIPATWNQRFRILNNSQIYVTIQD